VLTLLGQQPTWMPYPRRHQNQGLDLHQALAKMGASINSPSFQRSDTHHNHQRQRTLIKKESLALAMAQARLHQTYIKF
jgi:hypothetical protein